MATIKVSCQKDTEDIDRAPIGRSVGKIEVGTTIMYTTQLYMNLLISPKTDLRFKPCRSLAVWWVELFVLYFISVVLKSQPEFFHSPKSRSKKTIVESRVFEFSGLRSREIERSNGSKVLTNRHLVIIYIINIWSVLCSRVASVLWFHTSCFNPSDGKWWARETDSRSTSTLHCM